MTPIFVDDVDLGETLDEDYRMEAKNHLDITEVSKIHAFQLETNQTLKLHEQVETN